MTDLTFDGWSSDCQISKPFLKMIDTQLPCALFISDFTDPEALTLEILKEANFPKCNYLEGDIKAYPWKIDTKYYQTTIHLCPIKCDTLLPGSVIDLMEAAVLYFDTNNKQSFENVKKWTEDMKDDLPEILLLICDTFKNVGEEGIPQSTAVRWCLENGFELIELDGSEMDDDVDIDYNIIPDKKGVERIIEALHTHMWPNLDMKPSAEGSQSANDELGSDDFCELFSQLHTMKESLAGLPQRDRRACAEQVVSTFWKAIGGDNEELDED